jgi:DNA-directed RNA polymerase subunit RPC12/RpoP
MSSFFGGISEAYRISYTKPKPCAQCGRAVDPNAHRLTKDGRGVLCPDCDIKEEEQ